MKTTLRIHLVALLASSSLVVPSNFAQTILFSDDFDTDTSANWSVFEGSGNATPDYTAQFAFDYSTNKFVRNGVTNTIPPSPNGGGTSKGLKLTVNDNDAIAATAAVSLYPMGQVFSNDYALRCDLWMNYPGAGFGTAAGETEYSTFGINHVGDKVNWALGSVSDGVWFAVDGDGDDSQDYRSFVGDNSGPPVAAGGFLDRDGDTIPEDNAAAGLPLTHPLRLMFPSPQFEASGMPSKQWVEVEVRQRTNALGGHAVTWLINGYVIAEHSNGDIVGQTMGNVMVGMADTYSSIASPKEDSFCIFDNVRVVDLAGVAPPPVVTVVTNDDTAAEPGSDTGSVTISRTGSTAAPLTVYYRMAGTASNGVDYVLLPGSVTLAAGDSSTNITVTPIDDAIGEPTETAILVLMGNTNYDIYTDISATVTINDDGDLPKATVTPPKPFAYEPNAVNPGRFEIVFAGSSASPVTVNYSLTGTAVNGTDYNTLSGSVVVAAGETNATIHVTPINNLILDGSRTVILTLASGTNYTVGSPNQATVTIRDDETLPKGTVVFTENFETDTSASWTSNVKSDSDGTATFAYDYSADGIPPAPNSGTTKGLKLVGNETTGVFGGLSVSPTGQSFTGDFMLRFDKWINYPGPLPSGGAGSTEFAGGGIGTSGNVVEVAGSGNGLFFAATGDGGFSQDYRVYFRGSLRNIGAADVTYPGGSQNSTAAYYSIFGGEQAPASQQAAFPANQTGLTASGNAGFAWRDVAIIKRGTLVSWYLDSLLIATFNLTTNVVSTNISLVYWDPNNTISPLPALSFGLFDNVRVEIIAPPVITAIQIVGGNVEIFFTGETADTPASFALQQASQVSPASGYADVSATITSLGGGNFKAVRAVGGSQQYYRIRRL